MLPCKLPLSRSVKGGHVSKGISLEPGEVAVRRSNTATARCAV